MTREEWLKKYQAELGSKYEALFVEHVLPQVVGLRYEAIIAQYPFRDLDGRQRYCDFVIQEGDSIRIALEIDGYDKRGTGQGPSLADHLDYHRREASLVALGFRVLRFANIDVRDRPSRCADLITLTLKSERRRSLSTEEAKRLHDLLEEMAKKQNALVDELRKRTEDKPPVPAERSSSRNFVIASLVTLVVALAMVVVWQGGWFSAGEPRASKAETSCYIVDSIDEGIATCVQEDGSSFRVLATPGMREGTGPWPGATRINRSTPVAGASDHFDPDKYLAQKGAASGTFDPDAYLASKTPTSVPAPAVAGEPMAPPPVRSGAQSARAKPLPGSSCENPLNWDSAREHIGQTRAIAGRLVAVTESPPNTRGDPTWIEVGAPFPNSKRLSLVIWGNRRSSFPAARLQALMGTRVCVVGEIQDYKGVARIELRTPDQLRILE